MQNVVMSEVDVSLVVAFVMTDLLSSLLSQTDLVK